MHQTPALHRPQFAAAGAAPRRLRLHRCSSGQRGRGAAVERDHRQQQPVRRDWSVPGPGWHTFEIDNQSTGGGEIDLIDPANGAVYAEVENTGPGTVTPMTARPRLGDSTRSCAMFSRLQPDRSGRRSPWAGTRRARPPILPVTVQRASIPLRQEVPGLHRGRAAGARPGDRDARRRRPRRRAGDRQAGLADRPPAVPDARRGVRHVRRTTTTRSTAGRTPSG